jgi:colanic acid/amylovoran biosynthesis protein
MRILIIGQCTLHWGRLEYGNIGNYYITETTIRELHRVFPDAEIVTTFQMTDEFCQRERITRLPMELFYTWSDNDLDLSLKELGIATIYNTTGKLVQTTQYIEEVLKSDLVIDFSGEMWGDHAEPVGKNRFLVGLLKDHCAQLLRKPVVLLAGSQGPFNDEKTKELARQVFKKFKVVASREPASIELLKNNGFDTSNAQAFADPGFLFEPAPDNEIQQILKSEKIIDKNRKTVGFILCGFNFIEGPYDKWPRQDSDYEQFANAVEYIVNQLDARVVLMSHQNGFELPPNFRLINGRDYPIVKQLQSIVEKRGLTDMQYVHCIDRPYLPKETKAIIKHFDMLVTGRVHGLVASLSEYVPSVLINRGHGPIPHRNIGFTRVVGIEEYIADPHSAQDIIDKINKCWNNLDTYHKYLKTKIPQVKALAHKTFDVLREVV